MPIIEEMPIFRRIPFSFSEFELSHLAFRKKWQGDGSKKNPYVITSINQLLLNENEFFRIKKSNLYLSISNLSNLNLKFENCRNISIENCKKMRIECVKCSNIMVTKTKVDLFALEYSERVIITNCSLQLFYCLCSFYNQLINTPFNEIIIKSSRGNIFRESEVNKTLTKKIISNNNKNKEIANIIIRLMPLILWIFSLLLLSYINIFLILINILSFPLILKNIITSLPSIQYSFYGIKQSKSKREPNRIL